MLLAELRSPSQGEDSARPENNNDAQQKLRQEVLRAKVLTKALGEAYCSDSMRRLGLESINIEPYEIHGNGPAGNAIWLHIKTPARLRIERSQDFMLSPEASFENAKAELLVIADKASAAGATVKVSEWQNPDNIWITFFIERGPDLRHEAAQIGERLGAPGWAYDSGKDSTGRFLSYTEKLTIALYNISDLGQYRAKRAWNTGSRGP